MLTLGRASGEYVIIGGNIIVQVVEVGNQVRLAIDAPKNIAIERGESYEKEHVPPECIRRLRAKASAPKPYGFSHISKRALGDTEEI